MPIAARWRQVESDVSHAIKRFSMLSVLSVAESHVVSITALKSDKASAKRGKIDFVHSHDGRELSNLISRIKVKGEIFENRNRLVRISRVT